jgi:hypothetical protein
MEPLATQASEELAIHLSVETIAQPTVNIQILHCRSHLDLIPILLL